MNVREFLKSIVQIDSLITAKIKTLQELKSYRGLQAVRYDSVKVMSSNTVCESDLIVKIVDLENDINKSIDELVDLKKRANGLIDKLDDNRYKSILFKRYLNNETFEKISVDMGLSWKWTHKLHKEALEALEKI